MVEKSSCPEGWYELLPPGPRHRRASSAASSRRPTRREGARRRASPAVPGGAPPVRLRLEPHRPAHPSTGASHCGRSARSTSAGSRSGALPRRTATRRAPATRALASSRRATRPGTPRTRARSRISMDVLKGETSLIEADGEGLLPRARQGGPRFSRALLADDARHLRAGRPHPGPRAEGRVRGRVARRRPGRRATCPRLRHQPAPAAVHVRRLRRKRTAASTSTASRSCSSRAKRRSSRTTATTRPSRAAGARHRRHHDEARSPAAGTSRPARNGST